MKLVDLSEYNNWCGDVSAERVLTSAINAKLTSCLIIGYADDDLFSASTTGDVGQMLLMIERFRRHVLDLLDDQNNDSV
jgi:hypothetical protein